MEMRTPFIFYIGMSKSNNTEGVTKENHNSEWKNSCIHVQETAIFCDWTFFENFLKSGKIALKDIQRLHNQ